MAHFALIEKPDGSMSAPPVDVLVLTRRCRLDMQTAAGYVAATWPKLRDDLHADADAIGALRDAVTELIEADKEYDAAKDDLATQRRQVGAIDSAEARWRRADARRRAALASIGGAR